jgi:hypothetical protein
MSAGASGRTIQRDEWLDRALAGPGLRHHALQRLPLTLGGDRPLLEKRGQLITEDVVAGSLAIEQLDCERAPTDYLHWRAFGHSVAPSWEGDPSLAQGLSRPRKHLRSALGKRCRRAVLL